MGSQETVSRNGATANTENQEQPEGSMNRFSLHYSSNAGQQQQHDNKDQHHYYHEQQLPTTMMKSMSTNSMRSGRSISTLQSCSRSTEDETEEEECSVPFPNEEKADLSSSDPETATEVEVSEKTIKFKISTETAGGPGRRSYLGSRKGSREKSSFDHHNYEFAKAFHEHERQHSRSENLCSELNSSQSARFNEEVRILEKLKPSDQHDVHQLLEEDQYFDTTNSGCFMQKNGKWRLNNRLNERTHSCDSTTTITDSHHLSDPISHTVNQLVSTFQVIPSITQENQVDYSNIITREQFTCRCCDDKHGTNHHKSLLSRLRNFTDRFSNSFDSKDCQGSKPIKYSKSSNKSSSINTTSSSHHHPQSNNIKGTCKKCNLLKFNEQLEKCPITSPNMSHRETSKQKIWRTVFAKEKRPSLSLEALSAESAFGDRGNLIKHRRNLSNPEGKIVLGKSSLSSENLTCMSFQEIDFRPTKSESYIKRLDPGSSRAIEDIGNY